MATTYNNLYLDTRARLKKAGVEAAQLEARELVCYAADKIREQLDACRTGRFTDEELLCAKQGLLTQLQSTHDSPGSIENYYASGILSGLNKTPAEYMEAVEQVSALQVQEAAQSLQEHTVYFLRGKQS